MGKIKKKALLITTHIYMYLSLSLSPSLSLSLSLSLSFSLSLSLSLIHRLWISGVVGSILHAQ
jgi:hypothetical protein